MKHLLDFNQFNPINESAAVDPNDRATFKPVLVPDYSWFSLTYESNEELNNALKNATKQAIAFILVRQFNATRLSSYLHSNIVFAVKSRSPYSLLESIRETLTSPIESAPSLLLNITMAAQSEKNVFMNIHGSERMNQNFLDSIAQFYTP